MAILEYFSDRDDRGRVQLNFIFWLPEGNTGYGISVPIPFFRKRNKYDGW